MNAIFKCLADPTRREILALLKPGPMTAGDLADRFALAKPTLSGHFALLRNAGLIDAERHGTSITYHLNLSVLEEALLGLANSVGLAERLIVTRKEA
jgi:DNA-binding transcriptional ArsR family regulator